MQQERYQCPKCKQFVDKIDGEYARHYVVATILCTGSLRQVDERDYEERNGQ